MLALGAATLQSKQVLHFPLVSYSPTHSPALRAWPFPLSAGDPGSGHGAGMGMQAGITVVIGPGGEDMGSRSC